MPSVPLLDLAASSRYLFCFMSDLSPRAPNLLVLDCSQDSEEEMLASPAQHRGTLWETWGARQGWIKGIKAASTVATLALGFLALVETAFLFGVGKVRFFICAFCYLEKHISTRSLVSGPIS